MKRMIRTLALALAALAATGVHAAITCSLLSASWTAPYVTTSLSTNVTQSSFSLTCQRNVASDPTTLNYLVLVNNGINFVGQGNRAKLTTGTSLIAYENYRDSACTAIWKGTGGNRISAAMTLSGFTGTTVTTSFWGCVPASQTGLASGSYTDTVTMTVNDQSGGATLATNSMSVNIIYPAVCNITLAPGNVAFTYIAFRGTAATASSTFGVTCTNTLPYSLALDASSGVVSGLQYQLSLSAANATGTGSQQTFTINGTMPGAQAGTCAGASCNGTDTRTLTISY